MVGQKVQTLNDLGPVPRKSDDSRARGAVVDYFQDRGFNSIADYIQKKLPVNKTK